MKFTAMILKHWDDWIDMKIPALGNKTPGKAVKNKGRPDHGGSPLV